MLNVVILVERLIKLVNTQRVTIDHLKEFVDKQGKVIAECKKLIDAQHEALEKFGGELEDERKSNEIIRKIFLSK